MKVGRKIYYDTSTGNALVDTGERTEGVETTQEQDFANFVALSERVPSTVGVLQLAYGDFAADFAACNGYKVDLATNMLQFSYPDPANPTPVFQKPLTEEVTTLKTRLLATEQSAADNSLTTQQLLETLIDLGVI